MFYDYPQIYIFNIGCLFFLSFIWWHREFARNMMMYGIHGKLAWHEYWGWTRLFRQTYGSLYVSTQLTFTHSSLLWKKLYPHFLARLSLYWTLSYLDLKVRSVNQDKLDKCLVTNTIQRKISLPSSYLILSPTLFYHLIFHLLLFLIFT